MILVHVHLSNSSKCRWLAKHDGMKFQLVDHVEEADPFTQQEMLLLAPDLVKRYSASVELIEVPYEAALPDSVRSLLRLD